MTDPIEAGRDVLREAPDDLPLGGWGEPFDRWLAGTCTIIVATVDAARWRAPTEADEESDEQQFVMCRRPKAPAWERTRYYNLKHFRSCFHPSYFDGLEIMIADPLPLPEVPGE